MNKNKAKVFWLGVGLTILGVAMIAISMMVPGVKDEKGTFMSASFPIGAWVSGAGIILALAAADMVSIPVIGKFFRDEPAPSAPPQVTQTEAPKQ